MESHNLDSDLHEALKQATSQSSFLQKIVASFQMCYLCLKIQQIMMAD